jgi:mitochondrial fission protein ELM1
MLVSSKYAVHMIVVIASAYSFVFILILLGSSKLRIKIFHSHLRTSSSAHYYESIRTEISAPLYQKLYRSSHRLHSSLIELEY